MSERARRRGSYYIRVDGWTISPSLEKSITRWNWALASRRDPRSRSCRVDPVVYLARKKMTRVEKSIGRSEKLLGGSSGWVRGGRWPWTRGGGSKVSVEGRSREPGCSFSPDSVSPQGEARGCCFSSVSLHFSCRPSRGWFNRYFQWQREERRVKGSRATISRGIPPTNFNSNSRNVAIISLKKNVQFVSIELYYWLRIYNWESIS